MEPLVAEVEPEAGGPRSGGGSAAGRITRAGKDTSRELKDKSPSPY